MCIPFEKLWGINNSAARRQKMLHCEVVAKESSSSRILPYLTRWANVERNVPSKSHFMLSIA